MKRNLCKRFEIVPLKIHDKRRLFWDKEELALDQVDCENALVLLHLPHTITIDILFQFYSAYRKGKLLMIKLILDDNGPLALVQFQAKCKLLPRVFPFAWGEQCKIVFLAEHLDKERFLQLVSVQQSIVVLQNSSNFFPDIPSLADYCPDLDVTSNVIKIVWPHRGEKNLNLNFNKAIVCKTKSFAVRLLSYLYLKSNKIFHTYLAEKPPQVVVRLVPGKKNADPNYYMVCFPTSRHPKPKIKTRLKIQQVRLDKEKQEKKEKKEKPEEEKGLPVAFLDVPLRVSFSTDTETLTTFLPFPVLQTGGFMFPAKRIFSA